MRTNGLNKELPLRLDRRSNKGKQYFCFLFGDLQ